MPTGRPPSTLYRVHRVLIATGIFCCFAMTLWGVRTYRAGWGTSSLVVSALGVLTAVGLVFYLRYFNAKISPRR